MKVAVDAARLPALGPADGVFRVVTNPELVDDVRLVPNDAYVDSGVLSWPRGLAFENVLAQIPEPAHVLVISARRFFRSPSEIGRRKLLVLSCASTPTSMADIQRCLDAAGAVNPAEEDARAARLLQRLEATSALQIEDVRTSTSARFHHLDGRNVWHQQTGSLGWGEQQILPSGKVSVTPGDVMQYDSKCQLAISGSVTLSGPAIVHVGAASALPSDQARIHSVLETTIAHPLVARIELGQIIELHSPDARGRPALELLEQLFHVDSRYRSIREIGVGLSATLKLGPGNVGMHECYGGPHGTLHLGLGLTPTTQYAFAFILPNSRLASHEGEVLAGDAAVGARAPLAVRRSGRCACQE